MADDRVIRAGTRYSCVQFLRFAAALLVVVTHGTLYAHERLDRSFSIWRLGGTLGVEIFFCISGFVMIVSSRSLVDRRDGWKFFAARRLVRIVPMYWLATTVKVLALLLASGAVLHATLDPGRLTLSYLFLPSRNVDGAVEPLLGVGWTLIFEMFFYLLYTVALRIRVNVVHFCAVILVLCTLASTLRGDSWVPALVYLNPIVLNFLVGMLLGRWVLDGRSRRLMRSLVLVMGVWTLAAALDASTDGSFDWAGLVRHSCVVLVLVAAVVGEGRLGRRLPAFLVVQGDASYSMYLFHPLTAPAIPVLLAQLGLVSGYLSVGLTVVAVPIMAALIFRYVEQPLTARLQRRAPYIKVHPPGRVEPSVPGV